MNRRSVLRWLGLAPVAAPAAVAAASASAPAPIDYSGLASDIRGRIGAAGFSFDASTGTMTIDASRISLVSDRHEALITSEAQARAGRDRALASRIDGVAARAGALVESLP
jgi:hypothetical protein